MHYYSFQVILDPIMVKTVRLAMLSKQDHDRAWMAGSTHEIQDFDPYWLDWLVIKLIRTLI
jgi:hypothetical protein